MLGQGGLSAPHSKSRGAPPPSRTRRVELPSPPPPSGGRGYSGPSSNSHPTTSRSSPSPGYGGAHGGPISNSPLPTSRTGAPTSAPIGQARPSANPSTRGPFSINVSAPPAGPSPFSKARPSARVPPPGGRKLPCDGPVDDSSRITPQDSGKRPGDVPSGQPPSKQHRGEEDDGRGIYADRQIDDPRDDWLRDEDRQREQNARHNEDRRQGEEQRVREEREREAEDTRCPLTPTGDEPVGVNGWHAENAFDEASAAHDAAAEEPLYAASVYTVPQIAAGTASPPGSPMSLMRPKAMAPTRPAELDQSETAHAHQEPLYAASVYTVPQIAAGTAGPPGSPMSLMRPKAMAPTRPAELDQAETTHVHQQDASFHTVSQIAAGTASPPGSPMAAMRPKAMAPARPVELDRAEAAPVDQQVASASQSETAPVDKNSDEAFRLGYEAAMKEARLQKVGPHAPEQPAPEVRPAAAAVDIAPQPIAQEPQPIAQAPQPIAQAPIAQAPPIEPEKTVIDWANDQSMFAHLPPLPVPWIRIKSRSGQIYYLETNSGATTFVQPMATPVNLPPPPQPLLPMVPLGWSEHTSRSTGQVYFFHIATGMTTFDRPMV